MSSTKFSFTLDSIFNITVRDEITKNYINRTQCILRLWGTAEVSLEKTQRSILYRMNVAMATAVIRAAKTSRSNAWVQCRSKAALRRCGAPLCLRTYSTHHTARSMDRRGSSLYIAENLPMVSL